MTNDPTQEAPDTRDELLKLFEQEERNFWQRQRDMFKGLGCPKDSVEYKQALIELQRWSAPVLAVLLILAVVVVMSIIRIEANEAPPTVEMQIVEELEAEELVEEEPPPPEEPPELEEIVETDVVVEIDAPPTDSAEQSPQPTPVDSVAITSGVVVPNVYGSRNPGLRGAKIGRFGAGATEKYVYGFLRWLKMKQAPNGMWEGNAGITSMALLCYLAHGELPGQSDEFGTTVEKAIRALMDDQIKTEEEAKKDHPNAPRAHTHEFRRGEVGYFRSRDKTNYSQSLCVYALAEAYAMTRIPDLKPVVERAIKPILDGQNADGGWYYNFDAKCTTTDTSFASWAVQALKAAKLAGFHDPKIVAALKKAARGIKTCMNEDGSFGYLNTNPKNVMYQGLTAPCVLILQMLDEGGTEDYKKALAFMNTWDPTFKTSAGKIPRESDPPLGRSAQYTAYYLSQVRFNQGESHPQWKRWNEKQKRLYTAAAITIPAEQSGYKDHTGKPQYITYWGTKGANAKYGKEAKPISDLDRLTADKSTKNGRRAGYDVKELINQDVWISWMPMGQATVFGNCLTALQLMVYYRNSPLAKGALTKIEEEAEVKVTEDAATEITIEGLDDL